MKIPEAESLSRFLEDHPDLKFIFTGGKGGVGKTVVAAGIALHFAESGERILLASLNPAHSLSTLFEQELGPREREIEGCKDLYALEVDIGERKKQYMDKVSERFRELTKWSKIDITDEIINIAATNPAFEESAMFEETVDIMLKKSRGFDKVVFDTAAVANAVRLLALSKIYGIWLDRMIKSRKEALSLRSKLSFRKEEEEIKEDPLLADLLDAYKKMKKSKKILMDPEKTRFFFVTIPTVLSVSVVKRFIRMVRRFEIPDGGVVVNMVIPEDEKFTEFLGAQYEEQSRVMKDAKGELGPIVRSVLPLYEREVIGLDMVRNLASDLFSESE